MEEGKQFRKGMEVEVKNDEPGFEGSWYTATIYRVLSKHGRFSVEYDSLLSDYDKSEKLKEIVDVSCVRPRPPVEMDVNFKLGDVVDAAHNDGWWEGTIKEDVGDSRFVVHFSRTKEEFEFERSKLRRSRDWIDGKWLLKAEEDLHGIKVSGEMQCQGNNHKMPINPTTSEGQGEERDGQQLRDDIPLWSIKRKVKFESLAASKSSLPYKKFNKGEETRDSQLGSKQAKPSIGLQAQNNVIVIAEEEQELEKPGRGPKQKKRKVSPGKTLQQQTTKKACNWRQQPVTETSNTESQTTDAEDNTSSIVKESDFIEPAFPLSKCNLVSPQLPVKSVRKAILLPVADEELFKRKAVEPLDHKEASNLLNEGQLEQTREGNALPKDIGAPAQLSLVVHAPLTSSMDSQAFGVRCNETNSKEKDKNLQSFGLAIEESKGVIPNKESLVFPPANDETLSTMATMPFGKSSSVWQMVERMEAFDSLPQNPHFHPLNQHGVEYREGMALGHMFMFANVVANTRKSQPDDPPAVFEERLKALAELEEHGFNIKPIQARLKEMLGLKGLLEDNSKKAAIIEEKILEREHANDILEKKISHMDLDIIKHEQQLVLLHKKRELTLEEKESIGRETARLQKQLKVILDRGSNAKHDFCSLAASPW